MHNLPEDVVSQEFINAIREDRYRENLEELAIRLKEEEAVAKYNLESTAMLNIKYQSKKHSHQLIIDASWQVHLFRNNSKRRLTFSRINKFMTAVNMHLNYCQDQASTD